MEDRTTTPSDFNARENDQVNRVYAGACTDPPCLLASLNYLHLRWSVIPLCPADHSGPLPPKHCELCNRPGKQPPYRWKKYQEERATADQVREWWAKNPALNVGVVLGKVSGLVAFDVDGESGEKELQRLFSGQLPVTLEFESGRGGRRLFFRVPSERSFPHPVLGVNKAKLDFLSTGSQTVMPPSIHASGRVYRWTRGFDPTYPTIAELDSAVLDAVEGAGGRRSSLPGGGGRGPVLLVNDQARQLVRARAHMQTWDPCVSGESGQKVIFNKCCVLVHGFRLSDDGALSLLLEYNQRCQPPWSDEELRHHIEGARERGDHPVIEERPLPSRPSPAPAKGGLEGNVSQSGYRSPLLSVTTTSDTPADVPSPTPRASTRSDRDTPRNGESPDAPPRAMLASQVAQKTVNWLVSPYIPRGMLTMVVGQPATGKSTFMAWLTSKASRVVVLPGHEEDPGLMLLPRLRAHSVNLNNVLILQGSHWDMPHKRDQLVRMVQGHGADLVVVDPVDSYISDGYSENDGQHVRAVLEAFAYVAQQTTAAVVGVRHPGKDPTNVMVGSRQWRAVPRAIVELLVDAGPPQRRIVRPYKDSLGQNAPARCFDLVGRAGQPLVFQLRELVDPDAVELVKEVPDRIERSKIDQAVELLRRLLANGEVESRTVYAAGEAERLKDRTIRYAAEQLRLVTRRDGFGPDQRCFWSLPISKEGAA